MPKFSSRSAKFLEECEPILQDLFNEVVQTFDCTILCGHRGQKAQNEAYKLGLSKLQWPNSKHNRKPSQAIDVAPFVNGKVCYEKAACCYFAGYVMSIAHKYAIKLRWGGDWDSDHIIIEHTFQDLVHFELVE